MIHQPQVPVAHSYLYFAFIIVSICLASSQAFLISLSSSIASQRGVCATGIGISSPLHHNHHPEQSSTNTALFASPSSSSTTDSTSASHTMLQHQHQHQQNNKEEYSKEQLKAALDSLLADSDNPSFDARHIFGYGYGVEDHQLSMLQTVTATVLLDYQSYMVRSRSKNYLLDYLVNRHTSLL